MIPLILYKSPPQSLQLSQSNPINRNLQCLPRSLAALLSPPKDYPYLFDPKNFDGASATTRHDSRHDILCALLEFVQTIWIRGTPLHGRHIRFRFRTCQACPNILKWQRCVVIDNGEQGAIPSSRRVRFFVAKEKFLEYLVGVGVRMSLIPFFTFWCWCPRLNLPGSEKVERVGWLRHSVE
jgi:hypothetical protein